MSEATERIEQDIAQTRQELGNTAEALAAKTDVKARAHDKIEDVKEAAATTIHDARSAAAAKASATRETVESNPFPFGAVATAVGLALIAVWVIRRRD
jgi:ElaB/YqjD/DUF883 family membrane-anchored ribosome-binding protein